MTNPNDAIGTNSGFNGRTTPQAFNDLTAAFSRGIVSGWACSPKAGMVVQLGGNGTARDVAIAEDNAGNRTTINNRLASPVEVTIGGAPASNNRIDAIVAYAENNIQGAGATSVDFPDGVGLIVVEGTTAATPTAPNETAIRAAITADGASGTDAYYVVLATILVGTSVTTIGSGVITQGTKSSSTLGIPDGSITAAKLASNAVTTAKIADGAITPAKIGSSMTSMKRTELFSGDSNANVTLSSSVANFDEIEITFRDTNSTPNQLIRRIPATAGSVTLDIPHPGGSSTVYWNVSRWTISGTTMTKSSNSYQKTIASTSVSTTTISAIHITKVVGIKYTQN